MTRAHRDAGFTLLEMLVAMGILALVVTLAAGGMRFVSAGWERGARAAEANAAIGLVQDLLRGKAAAAVRLFWPDETRGYAATFSGEPKGVAMVVVEPPYPDRPGLATAIFRVEQAGANQALRFARAPFDRRARGFAALPPTDDLILAETGGDFSFSYYGAAPGNSVARWFDRWTDTTRPPRLIRLRTLDRATGDAIWPEIVVPFRIEAEADCVAALGGAADGGNAENPAAGGEDAGTGDGANATDGGDASSGGANADAAAGQDEGGGGDAAATPSACTVQVVDTGAAPAGDGGDNAAQDADSGDAASP
jgi:general secretion pathway protein J